MEPVNFLVKKIRHPWALIFLLSLLFCLWIPLSAQAAVVAVDKVKIGVLALRGVDKTHSLWDPTAAYLTKVIPGTQFSIVPLNNDSMVKAVANQQIDFILSNPALYATLESRYGISRIVTLKNSRMNGAYTKFGALILAKANRPDLSNLQDLNGKSFMAVHPNAFGGWWMALRVLKNNGIDPAKDFSRLEYSGLPQDQIVEAIRDGKIDAGTVRTDLLERMVAEGKVRLSDFIVLNPRAINAGFPFLHSTQLYPEWALATTKGVTKELAQNVAIELLKLPPEHEVVIAAKSAGWTIPLDYQPVHELMKELKVGHYKDFGSVNLSKVIIQYLPWISLVAAVLFAMVAVTIYIVRINYKLEGSKESLEVSKKYLEQEIMMRTRIQKSMNKYSARIQALYKVSSLHNIDFKEQVNDILKLSCKLYGFELGRICKVNADAKTFKVKYFAFPEKKLVDGEREYSLDKSVTNLIFSVGHAYLDNDFSIEEYLPITEGEIVGSCIGSKVRVNGNVYGTIEFFGVKRSRDYEAADKDLLNLISHLVGVTLERDTSARQLHHSKINAEVANNAKSDFLANMSHELRTPLNAIIGYSELIQESWSGEFDDISVDDVGKIHTSAIGLLTLINDILDLSKVEAGKMEVQLEEFKVQKLFEGIESLASPLAKKNNNSVKFSKDSMLDGMFSDQNKTRQTLLNLISNACKFTHNGKIELSAKLHVDEEKEWVKFSVSDTGPGISVGDIDKLFIEFSQVGDAKQKISGTGLGLVISKGFCKILGGNIEVESTLGVGTVFTVTLPRLSQPLI